VINKRKALLLLTFHNILDFDPLIACDTIPFNIVRVKGAVPASHCSWQHKIFQLTQLKLTPLLGNSHAEFLFLNTLNTGFQRKHYSTGRISTAYSSTSKISQPAILKLSRYV
jgi:hypothetical protein